MQLAERGSRSGHSRRRGAPAKIKTPPVEGRVLSGQLGDV